MEQMKITKQLITPAIAEAYLDRNEKNRNVSIISVRKYANDMAIGAWKENTYEFIKIGKSGRVLDGQHRLLAIVMANVPVVMHVAFDVDESVFDVLDTGKYRSAGDVFTIEGVKNAKTLSGIMIIYKSLLDNKKTRDGNRRPTNAELLAIYRNDVIFWDGVTTKARAWYMAFSGVLSPSTIGGFYALFTHYRDDVAHKFMDQLCTGKEITNNTLYLLRNKLIADKVSNLKMKQSYRNALIIKAWNFFVRNKSVKSLQYDEIREDFPIADNIYINNMLS